MEKIGNGCYGCGRAMHSSALDHGTAFVGDLSIDVRDRVVLPCVKKGVISSVHFCSVSSEIGGLALSCATVVEPLRVHHVPR